MDVTVSATLRNLVTGTATKYVLLALNIGLGVFLMPFTLQHLGTSEYGLWMLVASLTYYFQLLDLGYGSGIVRHIAEADARRDIDRANAVMSTFVVVYSVLGLLAAAGILALIAWVVPRFPNLDGDQIRRAQLLLALFGVRIAVGFPMTIFGAATTARQRFALNNTVAIVVTIANGAATYLVLSGGHGLVMLAAVTTSLYVSSYAAYAWTARRAFPEMRIRVSKFSRTLIREVTTYSIYVFVIDIAIQIGFNLDNVIVAASMGTAAVGVYAIALRLADYQRQLANQFNGMLFPVVVRFGAAGRNDVLRDVLFDGTRIALTLVGGVTVCLVAFGRPLVTTWMGGAFENSIPSLYVLALTGVILVGQGPLGNVLLGTGRHRLVAFASLVEALANLALSYVLVRRIGLLGVAIGTAVPVVIVNIFVLMPAACRQIGVRVRDFARAVTVAPLVGAVPSCITAIAFRVFFPADSLLVVLSQGALTGLVYLVAVVAVGLDATVRRRYIDQIRDLVNAGMGAGRAGAKATV